MSLLFTPITLRKLEIRNRIVMAPMCQYSATDGVASPWHMVHYGARATGGAGLVVTEAVGVTAEGRISAHDLGLWNDAQTAALKPVVAFIRSQGAVPAIQLAHAGRKASVAAPWDGNKPRAPGEPTGWQTLAPSALAFAPGHPVPRALTVAEIDGVVASFEAAAKRALEAGFLVAQIHMAHGYLLHEFLSPLSNQRTDDYGGALANRIRLPVKVAKAVRAVWPADWPVMVRISATDWVEGGWDLDQSVALAQALKEAGIDLIDCSTGGNVHDAKIPVGPGFQTPFAAAIRARAHIATGAVGLITEPMQAEHVLRTGQADVISLGRELLRDPNWPLRAAKALGDTVAWPRQYERAR
ncbi:MAG: NADH:flavin oxidoreductase/NADH oxidase [Rhodospirillales bacterium]|nr:NADH:flavin oxidoreductase/NADH oxidase [Rhodospirillales bacterium]